MTALAFARQPRVEVRFPSGRVRIVAYPRTEAQVAALEREAEGCGGVLVVKYPPGKGGWRKPAAQARYTHNLFFAEGRRKLEEQP